MGGGEAVALLHVWLGYPTISALSPPFQVYFKNLLLRFVYFSSPLRNMATDCEAWLNANPVGKWAGLNVSSAVRHGGF